MSSAERLRPIAWLRNSAASVGVKRKSAARSSVNWPRARKPGQRELRILSGGDDQLHLRRQMIEQKGERFIDRFAIERVIIVEDEDELIGDGGQFVEQRRQQRHRSAAPAKHCNMLNTFSPHFGAIVCTAATKYSRKRARSLSPSSSDNHATLTPDPLPGRGRGEGRNPFADQRGLAKAGRRRDERQFRPALQTFIQPFDQARTGDSVRPRWRDIQFGG